MGRRQPARFKFCTSGTPVEVEVTYVYEVRDHQIAKIDEYDTLDEARDAAGLSN